MERTLIVGLGNPGSKYVQTRHNIGFLALDRLAYDLNVDLSRQKFNALFGQGSIEGGGAVSLLKPQTFMNLSGKSVAPCAQFFQVPPQKLIVIHDELEFPFGQVRVKVGGGHAGHNGLRSIIERLGSREFIRIRVGIGRPKHGQVSDYVLSAFNAIETPWIDDLCRSLSQDVQLVIKDGPTKAMNALHARPNLIPT